MKRETLEKALELRDDILQIERMSTMITTGRKAYFAFHEGHTFEDNSKRSIMFSERMTTKMISMLQEYKLELEKEIEAL